MLIRNSTPPIGSFQYLSAPPPSPFREGKIQIWWIAKYSFPGENYKTPGFDRWLVDWATYKWQNADAKAVKWKATTRFRQVQSGHLKGMPSKRGVWGGGSKLERPNIKSDLFMTSLLHKKIIVLREKKCWCMLYRFQKIEFKHVCNVLQIWIYMDGNTWNSYIKRMCMWIMHIHHARPEFSPK